MYNAFISYSQAAEDRPAYRNEVKAGLPAGTKYGRVVDFHYLD